MGIAKNFKVKNGIEAGNTITAPAFVGDGSGLTNLDTADISTGILPVVRGGTGTNTSTGTGNTVLSISPIFTGITIVPTAEQDTNTTQVASTAFVIGQASGTNPLMSGSVAIGTSLRYARADHVHPIDTSRSPLAGNTSLTTVGTIGTGTWNATTIATTKGGTGLTSFTANKAIYATSTSALTSGTLPIVAGGTGSTTATGTGQTVLSASPIFTGVPEAPTAISSTNTTQIATTAFVTNALTNLVAGNVASATKLQTARTISMSGDVSWTSSPFDGSANISGVGTLASVATAGTYRSVTINAKGLVTSGTNPTTLAGYGLTDAAPIASPVFTGNVTGLGISTGTSFNGITALSSSNPLMDSAVAIGTSTTVARADHVHPIDTSRSPLAGNTSLTTVGTIGTGTWNATTIATTKGGTGLTSFNVNGALYATNASTLTTGTLPIAAGGTGTTSSTGSGAVVLVTSPGLQGTPTTPTATVGTNTTQIASTQFVSTAVANTVAGNVASATKLQTARTIAMTGDVSWTSGSFDGTGNVTGTSALANSGVTAGTYNRVTVDAKGRVTAGDNVLTNNATATTQSANNNSTLIATTAYVDNKFSWVNNVLTIQVAPGVWKQIFPPVYS